MASSALASATFRSSGIALTAVVCTYNRYEVLPGSIDSLLEQEVAEGTVEIVVVDNSPDQSRAVDFARGYRHVTNLVYVLEPTPGLANARNRGIREARAPTVAFIDDDARGPRRHRRGAGRTALAGRKTGLARGAVAKLSVVGRSWPRAARIDGGRVARRLQHLVRQAIAARRRGLRHEPGPHRQRQRSAVE